MFGWKRRALQAGSIIGDQRKVIETLRKERDALKDDRALRIVNARKREKDMQDLIQEREAHLKQISAMADVGDELRARADKAEAELAEAQADLIHASESRARLLDSIARRLAQAQELVKLPTPERWDLYGTHGCCGPGPCGPIEVGIEPACEAERSEGDLVAFLERPDIKVGLGEGRDLVVHHKHWKFEGRAKNVIIAARAAILAERKLMEAMHAEEVATQKEADEAAEAALQPAEAACEQSITIGGDTCPACGFEGGHYPDCSEMADEDPRDPWEPEPEPFDAEEPKASRWDGCRPVPVVPPPNAEPFDTDEEVTDESTTQDRRLFPAELSDPVVAAGMTLQRCSPHHFKILGGKVPVDFWPFAKRGFTVSVDGGKGMRGHTIESAIGLARGKDA